jgi:hypothetical protein
MIKMGDKVSFVDGRGITWFGIAESTVKRGRDWPVIRVRIGRRVAEVPARDVNLWPTPVSVGAGRPDTAIPAPRASSERPAAVNERTPGSPFILGDMVTLTEPVNDGWRRRVPRGTRGVIIGRVRDGEYIVQFTSGKAATALAGQLRRFTPPLPGGRGATAGQLTGADR